MAKIISITVLCLIFLGCVCSYAHASGLPFKGLSIDILSNSAIQVSWPQTGQECFVQIRRHNQENARYDHWVGVGSTWQDNCIIEHLGQGIVYDIEVFYIDNSNNNVIAYQQYDFRMQPYTGLHPETPMPTKQQQEGTITPTPKETPKIPTLNTLQSETPSSDFTYEITSRGLTITRYIGNQTDVVVPREIDGYLVTTLSSSAFQNNENITSVSLPNSLTSIEARAFENCINLHSLDLKEGITFLGHRFIHGTKISLLIIPSTVETMEYARNDNISWGTWYAALEGANMLRYVVFADGMPTIPQNACRNNKSLQNITMPDTINEIGSHAFAQCSSLRSVNMNDLNENSINLPDGVLVINDNAFRDCLSVERVVFSQMLKSIEYLSFYNCSALMSVDFHGNRNALQIKGRAFEDCSNLAEIALPNNTVLLGHRFIHGTKIATIEIPSSIQTMEYARDDNVEWGRWFSALEGAHMLREVVFLDGLPQIPDSACRNCSTLRNISIPESITKIGAFAFTGCSGLQTINAESLNTVTLPEGIISISEYAFYKCLSIENLKLPRTLQEIRYLAFFGCAAISSVDFQSNRNAVQISGRAFEGCSNLQSLVLPVNTVYLGHRFVYGTKITTITIPSSVVTMEYARNDDIEWGVWYGSLEGANMLREVVFADGMPILPNNACRNSYSLRSVFLPDSILEIGSYAFVNCSSLRSINDSSNEYVGYLPNRLVTMNENIFNNCSALEDVRIPSTVQVVKKNAFFGCSSLYNVVFADNKNPFRIESRVFEGCTNLASLVLPSQTTFLGYRFINGTRISSIEIPAAITTMEYARDDSIEWGSWFSAFDGANSLNTIMFAEGINRIPDNACRSNTSIREVIIPNSVNEFGTDAFAERYSSMKMISSSGSYAQQYANENGIIFESIAR